MKIREEIIKAYHGSPYQFDEFDMSKIGSGDGLNKYGFGLYFADREDTAEYYAKDLSIGDHKETGFNIYEVKLNGNFYEWDYQIPEQVHYCVIQNLGKLGKNDDAEEMEREAEEYGDYWSMDSLYQWLQVVLGSQEDTSKFLVGCGVDGVIAQSPAHEGNVIVAYDENAIIITNVKKLGEGDLTEMIRREIWTINENPQQMDKDFVKTNLFTDEDRENVMSITNGDAYTRTISHIYAWLHQIKPYDRGGERNSVDDFNRYYKTELIKIHDSLTKYNKQIFPITNFDPVNTKEHPINVYSAIKRRDEIISFFQQIPSVLLRNLKDEIRKPVDINHYEYYFKKEIEELSRFFNKVDNLSDDKKNIMMKKLFSSNNKTFDNIINQINNMDVLYLSSEDGEKEVRDKVEDEGDEADILYDENNIMVVDVKSSDAMKMLSCGAQWCFSIEQGTDHWLNYAQNDHVNLIFNFNEDSDSRKRIVVLLPDGGLYDMYNEYIEEYGYLESLGVDNHINISNEEMVENNLREEVIPYNDGEYSDENVTDDNIIDQIYNIANKSDINILRGKEISGYVLKDGVVAGAIFTEISNNEYSFDVIVDPKYQGTGLGKELVEYGMNDFQSQNMDGDVKLNLDVVSPLMRNILKKYYGLRDLEKIGNHFYMGENNINEMVENQGYLAFHGSPNKISNFTDEHAGAEDATDQEGPGIYFTTSFKDAQTYSEGGYVYTVKLNPRKLLDESSSKDVNPESLMWLIKQSEDWESTAQNWSENPEQGAQMAVDDAIRYNEKENDVFVQIWLEFYRYDSVSYLRNMTKLGIDGIIVNREPNMFSRFSSGDNVKHIIIYNPDIIQIQEEERVMNEEKINEISFDMNYELDNMVNPDEIRDAGYAYNADMPQSVDEAFEDYTNVDADLLKQSVDFIEQNGDVYKPTGEMISKLLQNYFIGSQNINNALKLSNDAAGYFGKLMNVQKYLKKFGLIKEDLVYWQVDGDASADSSEYKLGAEGLNEDGTSLYTTTQGTVNPEDSTWELDENIYDLSSALEENGMELQQLADHLAKKLGYGKPKYYGEGTQGYAFRLDDDTMMKLTTDITEANEALALLNKDSKHLGNFYKVFQINKPFEQTYVIIREYLDVDFNRFYKLEKDSLIEIEQYNEENEYFDASDVNTIMSLDWNVANTLLNNTEELIQSNGVENFPATIQFMGIAKDLISNKINSKDVSADNSGFKKNGDLAYYDIGYSEKKGESKFDRIQYENKEVVEDTIFDLNEIALEAVSDVITERIMSWMPKAKAVTVKKKCKLGGNGDGTSTACNQGDISNLELKDINDDNKHRRKANTTNVAEDDVDDRHYFQEIEKLIKEEILTKGQLKDCETLEIPDYVENYLRKFESDEQLLRSGGLPDEILDQWAFGFTDKMNQIMPDQLIVRWRNDLENVKWEIEQKGLTDIEYANSVDLSEPVDVDYDKPDGWSEGFILQDGHHRYLAAKILNKPLNMELTIKMNPTLKLSNMGYDQFHRCIWKQVKGLNEDVTPNNNIEDELIRKYSPPKPPQGKVHLYHTTNTNDNIKGLLEKGLLMSHAKKEKGYNFAVASDGSKKYSNSRPYIVMEIDKNVRISPNNVNYHNGEEVPLNTDMPPENIVYYDMIDSRGRLMKDTIVWIVNIYKKKGSSSLQDLDDNWDGYPDDFMNWLKSKQNNVTQESNNTYNKSMIKEANIMSLDELPFKEIVQKMGGKIYSVGGAVRDEFLGKESDDLDIVITGIPMEKLQKILNQYGSAKLVGNAFGIINFKPRGSTEDIDIALPRTETPTGGGGYGDFDVKVDHTLPIEDDLKRRDLSINAIAKDVDGNVIDPFGGKSDLSNKIIRMASPESFGDDSLRMLRAVRFAARFGFTVEEKTLNMIKQNASKINNIKAERILGEFGKFIKNGGDELYFADLLRETGLYGEIFNFVPNANVADHWDSEGWNNIKTLGEFMFMLLKPTGNASDIFKTRLKGDVPTMKEIEALEKAWSFNADTPAIARSLAHNMFLTSPNSLNSNVLPENLKKAAVDLTSGQYPKTVDELAINGHDLMNIGLKGKEVGDAQKSLLINVYGDKIKNNKEELLNFLNKKRTFVDK